MVTLAECLACSPCCKRATCIRASRAYIWLYLTEPRCPIVRYVCLCPLWEVSTPLSSQKISTMLMPPAFSTKLATYSLPNICCKIMSYVRDFSCQPHKLQYMPWADAHLQTSISNMNYSKRCSCFPLSSTNEQDESMPQLLYAYSS